jgi:hypothetical protein
MCVCVWGGGEKAEGVSVWAESGMSKLWSIALAGALIAGRIWRKA